MSDQLKNKNVIITGSGSRSGIGAGLALGFAERGANIAVCDINEEAAKLVAEEISATFGVKTIAVRADVTNRAEVQAMIAKTVESFGHLDVMVNNAGVIQHAEFLDITDSDWRRVMDTNAYGTLVGMQEAIKQMIVQGNGGKIVNLSSIASRQGFPAFAHYSASKWAIVSLSQSAAKQFAPHKINVNCMGPGIVHTSMMDGLDRQFLEKGLTKQVGDVLHDMSVGIPLGRYSVPADLVGTAAFLASSDSDYMTGQNILIDGGMVMI